MTEIHINLEGFPEAPRARLETAVLRTLEVEKVPDAEISLTLLDDDAIRDLNRSYLGRDRPTDVLSFSIGEEDRPLGDVYVGVEEARRQAEEHGITVEEELVRLAVHGTLHVLGYDHPEGPEREQSSMFVHQEALVRSVLERPSGETT